MYSLTITRVRPNTNVVFMTAKTENDLHYYANNYGDITRPPVVTYSDDQLTQTVKLTANSEIILTNYVAEFSNTSSPLYDRTQWCIDNEINVSFSLVTSI
jgi:hypothetical protein